MSLELWQDPRVPLQFQVETGLLLRGDGDIGIPFQTKQGNRPSSRVEVGPSGFLSFSDVDLGVCLQFQTGSQVSSYVEAWNSAFLSSCKRGFRLPVELNWGPGAFLKFATRVSVLPSCCELILGVPFELVQDNQALSRVDGEICIFQIVTRPAGCSPVSS